MNNKTQLAKWREDAGNAYVLDNAVTSKTHPISAYEAGYLRAKQENEQALPLITGEPVATMAELGKDGQTYIDWHTLPTPPAGTKLFTHAQPLPITGEHVGIVDESDDGLFVDQNKSLQTNSR